MRADVLYDIEQLPVGWLIFLGVALLASGVWFIRMWAVEDDRKRRERRRQRCQQVSARNARKESTETVSETPGTSTPTRDQSAPAGSEVVPLPESPVEEET